MLSLFRTNQFILNILLLFYAFAVRYSIFVVPPSWDKNSGGVLSHWLIEWTGNEGILPGLIATLLLFFQGIMINVIISRHRMADEVTLFPGVFYILLSSIFPEFLSLNPILIANTFYLLSLNELFQTYRKYAANDHIYNTGFWIAVASLFYFSHIHLLILAFVGLSILRAFKLRERMVLLVGVFTPFFLLGTYSFITDQFETTRLLALNNHFSFLDFQSPASITTYLKVGFFALLIIVVLFSAGKYSMKKNIQVQKYISLFYWSLLLAGLSVLFQKDTGVEGLLVAVPALGAFLSFTFLSLKRPIAEALHLVIVFIAIILQLQLIMN